MRAMRVATAATIGLLGGGLGWLAVADPRPQAVAFVVGVGAATLLHELGHLAAATAVGVGVDELRLTPVSGWVRYAGDPDPLQRAAVSIAGPAASAAGVLVLAATPWLEGTPGTVVDGLAAMSLVLLVANLLPFPGSDGVQLVRALRLHAQERVDADGDPVG